MSFLLVVFSTLLVFGPMIFVLGAVVGISRSGRFSKGLLAPFIPKRFSGAFPLLRRDRRDVGRNGGAS